MHWQKFCESHHLNDHTISKLTLRDKELVIAFYGIYLSTGNTIKSKSIQTPTLKLYLKVAGEAAGVETSYDPNHSDDKKYLGRTKVSPVIRAVINEHHRWESVPNRREPITQNMIKWWIYRSPVSAPDSFDAAIADWMILGSRLGMRKSEWNQPSSNGVAGSAFSTNIDGSSKAFTAPDFTFHYSADTLTKSKPGKFSDQFSSPPYDLLKVRWRYQKNNDNGQEILFARDIDNPELCVVSAAYRILQRAQRLHIPLDHPIAVFSANGTTRNITDADARRSIQACARSVYNMTDKADLAKFSNHSVRVGACVAVHCGGTDTLTIKNRLRWRSDSFNMYLRNTPLLVAMHTKIYNTTNVDQFMT